MILLLCRLSVDYLTCPLVEFVSSLWVCCYMFFLLWLRYFLFIYLFFFFFAWCTREKKKSLSDILKLTINGLDLPLSTPTQPNPHLLLLHPSIHALRVEPKFCHCVLKKKSELLLCFFCHSWQFFLRIQFFSKSLRLSLSFSLSRVVSCLFTGADRPN